MKKRIRILPMILMLAVMLLPYGLKAQEQCDPRYSISNFVVGSGQLIGSSGEMIITATIGQPTVGEAPLYGATANTALGFWSFYKKEPQPPRVNASDGDFDARIEVSWEIIDDLTGPPVTGSLAKLYRNGTLLTTVPVDQTGYQDFNVFPGEFYNYEVVVENAFGESYTDGDVGFLNPNGMILGKVKTPNLVPVADVEVRLSPNLGRSLQFDGTSDYVAFDTTTVLYLAEAYTVEGWFRATPDEGDFSIITFTEPGENNANILARLHLDDAGHVTYTHLGTSISSIDVFKDQEWNHFAATHDGSEMILYVNGNIVASASDAQLIDANTNVVMGRVTPDEDAGYFKGYLDDLRVWDIAKTREDIRLNDQRTMNGEEDFLTAYWKFDEVLGEKVFDLTSHDIDGYICNVQRTEFKAPVWVSGLTDVDGNYVIKGIYYGSGTTFDVIPVKETPVGRSLDFDGIDDFVQFNFKRLDMTAGYTVEGWFKSGVSQWQTIFAASDPATDEVQLSVDLLSDGTVRALHRSGSDSEIISNQSFNDELWHHFAVSHDGSDFRLYVDGDEVGTSPASAYFTVESEFVIARQSANSPAGYFEGPLDEIRVWNYSRTGLQIGGTMNQTLTGEESGLIGYWNVNDGTGTLVEDVSSNGNSGVIINADDSIWVDDIPLNEVFVHIFDQESRQAILNPSNTAVDRVDFTDISQIAVSGFIRYTDTECFAEGVELLVNGETVFPPVITDADGKYITEFEPGTTGAILSPYMEGHTFLPPFIELPAINTPLAGITFNDEKTFTLSGKVAGGKCEFPITPSQGQIEVTISAVSGCIDTTVVPNPNTGEFTVEGLPPLIYNVSVNHPDPDIDSFFTADTVSLESSNRSINFIYRASPEVAITGFPENECGLKVLEELVDVPVTINIFESYVNVADTNTCPVDSGTVDIMDDMGDAGQTTLSFVDGQAEYTIPGGGYPNILGGGEHPYQKSLQVIATTAETNESVTVVEWAYVLGNRPRENMFTTATPEIPIMILRDPPGDASYSFLSQESSYSYSISYGMRRSSSVEVFSAVHLGPDVVVSAGAWGIPDVDANVTMDVSNSIELGVTSSSYFEQTWSVSTTETFQTSDDNAVVGSGGDVFVGGAMNIVYGITDILEIDENCNPVISQDIIIAPNGFATTYIYSESHIRGVIIPSLINLGDTESADLWQQVLDMNDDLKASATFKNNYSFDGAAGAFEYVESESSTQVSSIEFEVELNIEVAVEAGMELNGVGASGGVRVSTQLAMGGGFTFEHSSTNTMGFVLSDDDPGDFFSVDVLWDNTYGSPVFNTVSGVSSCPWEPNTAPREGVQLMADQTIAINVPPDEPAVFSLLLGNNSQTDEDGTFDIRIPAEQNPDGAVLRVNGIDFEDSFPVFLLAGQQSPVTLTVDRGPLEYEYDSLLVMLVSGCEYELWQDRGDATAPIPISDSLWISVDFSRPCSESNIVVPEDNWLITSVDEGDTLWVTVDSYDRMDPNLVQVELQYRSASGFASQPGGDTNDNFVLSGSTGGRDPSQSHGVTVMAEPVSPGGDAETGSGGLLLSEGSGVEDTPDQTRAGEWFVAATILKDDLIDDFVLMPWNISPGIVIDGEYELRAVAVCEAGLVPGTSPVVTGLIDRAAPEPLGAPEPVDGILGPDNEIVVRFNEDVECGEINPGAGHIALVNTVSGDPVDFTYTCGGNTVVIVPNIQNHFIENMTLRATVGPVQDIYGNETTEAVEWEFFVNRNPIEWTGGNISNIIIYEDETYSTTRYLINNGGSNRSWEINDIPNWLTVFPTEGTLTPGAQETVTISLAEDAGPGSYNETIYASGTMGDEPMPVDIRKLCYPPEWQIIPENYQHSMNIIATLTVDGLLSDDVYDMVGVFVGDELRGVQSIQFISELEGLANTHPYEVFITVYSNQISGEDLTIKVWDASECTQLGQVEESFAFEANTILGAPTSPVTITATSQIVQQLEYPAGWTWFSINISPPDMSTNSVLRDLSPANGDLIKSQVAFSQFGEGYGWLGTLNHLSNESMYMIRLSQPDTLEIIGYAVDTELDTIQVTSGWNWIGYLPQQAYDVNWALGSLNAITGDLVKSHFNFSMYVEGLGWLGSLTFMNPHLGYLLYSQNAGELRYPFYSPSDLGRREEPVRLYEENAAGWTVNPSDYEHTMTLVSTVDMSDVELIGAFSNGICRGAAQPVYVDALDQKMIFLMIYGEEDGESITFMAYTNGGEEIPLTERFRFESDNQVGTPELPYELSVDEEALIPATYRLSQNYPNPFNPVTHIQYGIPEDGYVEIVIYDMTGRQLKTLVSETKSAGNYQVTWNGRNDAGEMVPSGIYLYRMESGEYHQVHKLVLLK